MIFLTISFDRSLGLDTAAKKIAKLCTNSIGQHIYLPTVPGTLFRISSTTSRDLNEAFAYAGIGFPDGLCSSLTRCHLTNNKHFDIGDQV